MEGVNKLLEFQALMSDKRHKEVILKLDEILKSIPKEIPDNTQEIKNLGEIMKSLKFEPNAEIPLAIQAMGNVIVSQIQDLMLTLKPVEQPKEWEFTVERDGEGFLKKVKAISN